MISQTYTINDSYYPTRTIQKEWTSSEPLTFKTIIFSLQSRIPSYYVIWCLIHTEGCKIFMNCHSFTFKYPLSTPYKLFSAHNSSFCFSVFVLWYTYCLTITYLVSLCCYAQNSCLYFDRDWYRYNVLSHKFALTSTFNKCTWFIICSSVLKTSIKMTCLCTS